MNAIPFTNEVRQETGVYNAKLGIWLFLASETMFFGALYSSYVFLRTANPGWTEAAATLPVHLSFLTLVCTLGTAAASAQAWAVMKVDRGERPAPWLAAALMLAVLSAGLITQQHRVLAEQGITAATSNFYGMYFVLTELQRIHIVAGALFGLYHLVLMRRRLLQDAARYVNRVECLGLYWQFVALHWVVLMLLYYII